MRIAARVALAAVLTAGIVATTTAQQPRQGRGFGGGFGGGQSAFSMLANNKLLQEAIKITDEQTEKLKEAMKPIQEKQRELRGLFTPGERPSEEQMKEFREKNEKIAADTKKAVEGVLKEEQVKRLTQINYQLMGVNAFANKDVQSQLKVTDEQKEKIKGIVDEYTKDSGEIMRSAFGGGGGDREEIQKRMAENQKKIAGLAKEAEEKIAEKLTDEQKTEWKNMLGDKVDVAKIRAAGFQQRQRRDD